MSKPQQLPSGKWRIQWFDATGKRKSATFNTEASARAELRRKLVEADDIRTGRIAAPVTSPLFREFVNKRWLPTYPASAGNRKRTVSEKELHVEHHLMPELGDRRLDEIRGEVLDQLFAALHVKAVGKSETRKLSPKSIKNIRATLGTILRSAKKWGDLADVPELPRVKVPDQEWDFFTAEESAKLLAAAVDPEERALFLFALHTGARFGEQRAIAWGDIDWKSKLVLIRRSMPHNTSEAGPTKSGRERRVPMTTTLHDTLKSVRDLQHLKGGLIFGRRRDGKPLTLYAVRERLDRACRKAGLREIRWHDLRHSFASQLVSAGVPMRQVQEWLGHSTILMTMRYAHLAPGGGDAIGALDAASSAPAGEARSAAAGDTSENAHVDGDECTRGAHANGDVIPIVQTPRNHQVSEAHLVTPPGLEPARRR